MHLGFFFLFMGLLCFIYLICALRTNICFVVIFASLVVAFALNTGSYWQLAQGNAALASKLQVVSTLATHSQTTPAYAHSTSKQC